MIETWPGPGPHHDEENPPIPMRFAVREWQRRCDESWRKSRRRRDFTTARTRMYGHLLGMALALALVGAVIGVGLLAGVVK